MVVLAPIYVLKSGDFSYFATAAQWLLGYPLVHPVDGRLNAVMWSLIVELHFYMVLPFLFFCLKRFPIKIALWVLFLVMLFVPGVYRWWLLCHGVALEVHPLIDTRFPALLDAFAFGILLAGMDNLKIIRKSWAWLGDLGLLLLLAAMLARWQLYLRHADGSLVATELLGWAVKVAAALMLCYIANPSYPTTRFFSQPWLRWCGLISYEWYLFHQPAYEWGKDWLGLDQPHGAYLKYGLLLVGSLCAGLLVAALTYKYYSLPILKYGRNKSQNVRSFGA